MFDTHCHLQDKRIYPDLINSIIHKAHLCGVRFMLCCGTKESDWADTAAIGSKYSSVICAFGVHPWYADSVSVKWDVELEKYLSDNKAAAVGEIGLDYTADNSDRRQQRKVFIRQLDIAQAAKRPVSIHCRKAWGELVYILKKRGGLPYGGAIHSYSGSPDLVKELESVGCYISFSGSILNPNAKRARQSVKMVSPQKLLVETDSPDMLPHGSKTLFNEPSNLPMIIKEIAEILGKPAQEVALQTEKNGCEIWGCR